MYDIYTGAEHDSTIMSRKMKPCTLIPKLVYTRLRNEKMTTQYGQFQVIPSVIPCIVEIKYNPLQDYDE
jgi:hypothetical protein